MSKRKKKRDYYSAFRNTIIAICVILYYAASLIVCFVVTPELISAEDTILVGVGFFLFVFTGGIVVLVSYYLLKNLFGRLS